MLKMLFVKGHLRDRALPLPVMMMVVVMMMSMVVVIRGGGGLHLHIGHAPRAYAAHLTMMS